jgi:hypothetical protein
MWGIYGCGAGVVEEEHGIFIPMITCSYGDVNGCEHLRKSFMGHKLIFS